MLEPLGCQSCVGGQVEKNSCPSSSAVRHPPRRVLNCGLKFHLMRFMRCFLLNICLVMSLTLSGAQAAELAWMTDLPAAQAQANAQKKSILIYFHGSDWCPPCAQMQREVFQSPKFIEYAQQALVLVDADFPEKRAQSAELKQANLALKAKFNVGEDFPSIVLLDEAGETVFQEAGYSGEGPAEVLKNIQRHVKPPASNEEAAAYKNVGVDEFAKLATQDQAVILDVRTTREFQAGHLAGAMNIDVNAPDFTQRAGRLDKSRTYLVHCASGVRSVKACKELTQLGFSSLVNLTGGFRAWVKAGQPVLK